MWKHIKISLHWLVSPGHSAGIFASTRSTLYSFPGKGKTNEETSPCKRVAQETFEKENPQKTQLEKVGGDEPQRKVQKATEEHENERDAAAELQKQLTPAEKSRAWGRHQTHLCQKGHEEGKKPLKKGTRKRRAT